jgi:hypothetical protein
MARPAKPNAAGTGPAALIEALLQERPKGKYGSLYSVKIDETKNGPPLMALDREGQAEAVGLLVGHLDELDKRADKIRAKSGGLASGSKDWETTWGSRHLADLALRALLRRKLPISDADLAAMLDWVISRVANPYWLPIGSIASAVENRAGEAPLPAELSELIARVVAALRDHGENSDYRQAAAKLARLVSTGPVVDLAPGEAWSDAALEDLAAMDGPRQAAWRELLSSCQEAGRSKPTASWRKQARKLVEAVGPDEFRSRILRWLPLVDRPRTAPRSRSNDWEPDYENLIEPRHVELLRGLSQCLAFEADRDLARALAALALSSYRKVPGKGPRMPALGNAALAALGSMPGLDAVGQLALLKVKVKFIPAQKEVGKALAAAAEREGLPVEEIEELAVPAYGLEEVGRRREELGDYLAEIIVDGSDAELRWSKAADGKALKSVPAALKKEHADEVKDLQGAVKDIGKMLTAQKERIDGLFLARKRWPVAAWRDRDLDHPLVGTLARRLIWRIRDGDAIADAAFLDGRLVGVDDRPVPEPGPAATVELWHPIEVPMEGVLAWRDWLDRHRVRQPFKQAHREVYILTDAERATRVYSNRFAAHILRQHQFHSLCAARGWRNRLRLMVDDTYPPASRDLPEWGLRAEYWVEGIGDDYGTDTNDSGAYLHLATDQVRFYEIGAAQREAHAGGGGYSAGWNRADAEPVPLDRVPPLVLSEILRDVDLFVGVASVGNDPQWSDGGPQGRHVDYWNRYSFGDLSANGQTRKAVLERLIPRLKIAPRCSFSEKFLVVKGDLRTYKIHLGSGNILMEPNDQYLCIVPRRSAADRPADRPADGAVFLPFEGDQTLSVILSKALMLADDRKISDPTIVSQIKK